jgi:hypothetical protein
MVPITMGDFVPAVPDGLDPLEPDELEELHAAKARERPIAMATMIASRRRCLRIVQS